MGWPVFLLGPGLGPARAWARARSVPGPGWAGPWKKIYSRSSPCMQGGVEGAKPSTPHIYRQIPKLLARPIGVLTLGKVAAPSSPKHLLTHFPRPLFANSLELSFAKLIA